LAESKVIASAAFLIDIEIRGERADQVRVDRIADFSARLDALLDLDIVTLQFAAAVERLDLRVHALARAGSVGVLCDPLVRIDERKIVLPGLVVQQGGDAEPSKPRSFVGDLGLHFQQFVQALVGVVVMRRQRQDVGQRDRCAKAQGDVLGLGDNLRQRRDGVFVSPL
jgi:hypothetical protein